MTCQYFRKDHEPVTTRGFNGVPAAFNPSPYPILAGEGARRRSAPAQQAGKPGFRRGEGEAEIQRAKKKRGVMPLTFLRPLIRSLKYL